MNSLEKINDIQYLIMETYSDSEPLTENQEGSKNCFMQYCRDIRKDLKVLNLLKEKRVDLDWLSFCSSNSIKNTLEIYNKLDGIKDNEKQKLTLEEMALIVDWLRGNK